MTAIEFILLSQLNTLLGNLNGQVNDLITVLIAAFAQLTAILLDFTAAILPPYQ